MLESVGDDVGSILKCFEDLGDPRSSVNRKHLLGDLIVISICAVIAGADGPKAIGVWATSNKEWLKQHLELPYGIPSHDTIGRLLALLKPAAFQTCFENWIRTLRTGGKSATGEPTFGQQEVIAIDGKALRRSHDRGIADPVPVGVRLISVGNRRIDLASHRGPTLHFEFVSRDRRKTRPAELCDVHDSNHRDACGQRAREDGRQGAALS